jgi:hypothetical protein
MPMLLNQLNEFYNGLPFGKSSNTAINIAQSVLGIGKSIQKCYRFSVTIFPPPEMKTRPDIYKRVGTMPNIKAFHVKNISIPQYTYKKESQYYGPAPRSFPLLEHDGFEVKIEFEEDERGTIGNFISWLQRLAIDPSQGTYTPPDFVKLLMIGVIAESDLGIPIACYTLHDPFYLNATGPDFDYAENASIKYSISFNVDIINSFFPQSYYFSKLTSAITGGRF